MNIFIDQEKTGIVEKGILSCHDRILSMYPRLRIRWSKVFGKRKAHILGTGVGLSYSASYIPVAGGYELCIENPEILSGKELEEIRELISGMTG